MIICFVYLFFFVRDFVARKSLSKQHTLASVPPRMTCRCFQMHSIYAESVKNLCTWKRTAQQKLYFLWLSISPTFLLLLEMPTSIPQFVYVQAAHINKTNEAASSSKPLAFCVSNLPLEFMFQLSFEAWTVVRSTFLTENNNYLSSKCLAVRSQVSTSFEWLHSNIKQGFSELWREVSIGQEFLRRREWWWRISLDQL